MASCACLATARESWRAATCHASCPPRSPCNTMVGRRGGLVLNGQGRLACVVTHTCCCLGARAAALAWLPTAFSPNPGYLRNYANTRLPRILDTVREVVALHRHRFIFPISLCVTPVTLGGVRETGWWLCRGCSPASTGIRLSMPWHMSRFALSCSTHSRCHSHGGLRDSLSACCLPAHAT